MVLIVFTLELIILFIISVDSIPDSEPLFVIEKKGQKISDDNVEPVEPVEAAKARKKLKTTRDIVKNASFLKRLVPASKVEPIIIQTKSKTKSKNKRKPGEKVPKTVGKTIKIKNKVKPYNVWLKKTNTSSSKEKKPTSLLPAVEPPHPGTSFNPCKKDHRELVHQIFEQEKAKEKEEKHYNRVMVDFKKVKSRKQVEKEFISEMSAGLGLDNTPSVNNEEEETNTSHGIGVTKKVVRAENRKSKAQRRREQGAKLRELNKKKEKEKRRKEAQVFELKRLKREIKEEAQLSQKRQEERLKKKEQRMYQPHRLGPHKFEEPEVAFNLPSEIRGRLRTIKIAGNPFEDRFKSLQKRNIIEPRKLILKSHKKNLKYVTKRDVKEMEVKEGIET